MKQSASTNLQSRVAAACNGAATARTRPRVEMYCTQSQCGRMQLMVLQRRLAKPELVEMLRETCSESASDTKSFGSEFALSFRQYLQQIHLFDYWCPQPFSRAHGLRSLLLLLQYAASHHAIRRRLHTTVWPGVWQLPLEMST